MRKENVKEYELLRNEVRDVKNCITSYMGFSLGGSAFAFIIIDNITAEDATNPFISFTPIAIALIITLVLLIVFYKFNSHNRYAGYCKLLNEETWNIHPVLVEDIYTWEICIDRLRHFDTHRNDLISLCDDVTVDVEGNLDEAQITKIKNDFSGSIREKSGNKPEIDNYKTIKGIRLFFLSLVGKQDSPSWGFPIWVTLVFFSTNMVFILYGAVGLVSQTAALQDADGNAFNVNVLFISMTCIIFALLMYLWLFLFGKLYTLMKGSATVHNFYLRFIPIRNSYMREYIGITPLYKMAFAVQR